MQMRIPKSFRSILLLAAAVGPTLAMAQTPLTLSEAVSIALEKNPMRKMAVADAEVSKAQVNQARSAFLPHVGFTESATIGNDPVYAFGTKLRQGRFTTADFALNNLNYPEPIGNFASRIGGQWNVFNTFVNTFQLRSAKAMQEASQQQLTRADQETVYRVVDAYYSVLAAKKQVEVAEQTIKTAQALVDSSTARVESGMAVDADALSAKVNLAGRQQELIRAQSALAMARTQFETALGVRLTPGQQPAESLKEQQLPAAVLEETEALALKRRPDLLAAASQVDAQQNNVKAAKAAFGPRLNVFGSWEADNPSFASGGSTNWVTGAELQIDLFARDKNAQLSVQKAMLSKAEAAHQIAEDNIRLDVRRAYYEHDAASQMLEVSRATVAQADESMRIMRDRYDSGLITITDLLRAEDADRSSRTSYWQSVYRYAITFAALQLASGELTAQSPVVTQ
jgi:outer membrane protein